MPKKLKKTEPDGKCHIDGICQDWDSYPDISRRLRDGGPLLDPMTVKNREDIKTCAMNFDLLAPLLEKVRDADRKLPSIDDLRDEIAAILQLNKRQGPDALQMVDETARHIKKLLVFIKTKVRRHEVSTATRPKQTWVNCNPWPTLTN